MDVKNDGIWYGATVREVDRDRNALLVGGPAVVVAVAVAGSPPDGFVCATQITFDGFDSGFDQVCACVRGACTRCA